MNTSNLRNNLLLIIFFIIAFVLISIVTANAQSINSGSYKTAIGLRGGQTSGLTVKHFVAPTAALEGILGVWSHAVSLTVLYEKHASAFDAEGLRWYYGGGGHIASASRNRVYFDEERNRTYNDGLALGIDGIVGLEYKIPPIPFAISVDIKPAFEITTNGSAYAYLDPGLGIKFTF
jgi:hypothetical protein